MKDVDGSRVLSELEKEIIDHSQEAKFFSPPLSDFDIISLQNVLMTPAIHYIKTKNVLTGRFLMNTFLGALNHYFNIGCLTAVENQYLKSNVLDFSKLRNEATPFIDTIEQFCIENPYFDLVWIEITKSLQAQIDKKQLNKFYDIIASNSQTPIIVISYDEN